MPRIHARIYVFAGVNGAGKSSIGGAAHRKRGAEYFNPDEAARRLMAIDPALTVSDANSQAWGIGLNRLKRAIAELIDFTFETTLGGNTIPSLLAQAAKQGIEIHIWYAGLSSPELHIERVRARVQKGGHDIPEADIRRRYELSRNNLIALLPHLMALRVYDNSAAADPAAGKEPRPVLLLHMKHRKIVRSRTVHSAPDWAKPIVAAALKTGRRKKS